ncbi:MAG: hypothetical protein WB770_06625 [Acidimicrobiales bacterium]
MSAFRFATVLRGARVPESRPNPYPLPHVRILRSGDELQVARDEALAFENAAAEALQTRIERYVGLDAPRVVIALKESEPLGESNATERSDSDHTDDQTQDTAQAPVGSKDGFFTPTAGVA